MAARRLSKPAWFLAACLCIGLAAAVAVLWPDRPVPRLRAQDAGVVMAYGGAPGGCDDFGAREPMISEEGGTFCLFYDGIGPRGYLTCQATSTDLRTWEKAGVILFPGKPDEADSAAACGAWLVRDGTLWHLFYVGAATCVGRIPNPPYATMRATAPALRGPWTKMPGTVLAPKANTWYNASATPGAIIRYQGHWLMFFSGSGSLPAKKRTMFRGPVFDPFKRTLGIARADRLDGAWTIDPDPILPRVEQLENSSVYYEESSRTWFLFTNHIGSLGADEVRCYWTQDPEHWSTARMAVVLDGRNCTWSHICIGMPSVLRVGDRLAIFYDGPGGEEIWHEGRRIGLAWLSLPLLEAR